MSSSDATHDLAGAILGAFIFSQPTRQHCSNRRPHYAFPIHRPINHDSLHRMSDDSTTRILAAVELLGAKFERLDAKFEVLDTKFEVLNGKFEALDTKFERLDGKFEHLRGDVDRLRGDVMARMDRLQDSFNALRDDVSVNFFPERAD
jgi:hypothetical protein